MAFTKVVGPGIHTLSNIASHNINSSGIITATQFDGPFSNVVVGGATTLTVDGINISAGILTAQTLDLNGNGDISGNLVIGGNLTANGDFTTLNTTLREVELLRVDATDNTATAGIITQRGTGDILNLFDTSTEVLTVKDGGNLGVGTISPTHVIHSYGEGNLGGVRLENSHSTTTVSGNTAATAFPHNLILSNYSGLGSANDRMASIGFDIPTTGTYANATIAYQATSAGTGDLQFHLESGNAISERVRFTSSGKILTGNPVTLSHAESASLIVVSANASSGANMLSDSSAIYNHQNPSFLAVQNRYDTGTDQESGIILSQKHSQQGSWAIYGKRTGSYVSDLIFRNRTGGSASAERLRIDSDGRLLIGRSSAYAHADADNLIVGNEATNEHQGITILSHTGKYGGIYFGDGDGATGSNRGKIIYDHPNDQLGIGVGGSAATQLRITSAGDLGLSNTGTNSPNNYSGWCTLTINGTSGAELDFERGGTLQADILCGQNGLLYTNRLTGDYHAFATHNGTSVAERLRITDAGNLKLPNNAQIELGASQTNPGVLQIWHNGGTGNSNIKQVSGNLYFYTGSDLNMLLQDGTSVDLYYANSKRFETTSSGISVTGEVAASQDYPNQRPALDFNFAATKKLDPRLEYQRSGTASFTDEFGKLIKVGDNTPRFNHNFGTGESLGLLIEESSTNISRYSEKASGTTNWTQFGTISENVIEAPDGTMTADKLEAPSSGHGLINIALGWTANVPHTFSIFAKSGEFNRIGIRLYDGTSYFMRTTVNLDTGVAVNNEAGTLRVDKFANGWWRISTTGTPVATYTYSSLGSVEPHNTALVQQADTSSSKEGIYIWGWQMEAKPFPSSYIATDGAEVTRGQDFLAMTGSDVDDIFNPTEGTMFYEASVTDLTNDNQPIVSFRNSLNTSEEYFSMGHATGGSAGKVRVWAKNSAGTNVHITTHSTSLVADTPYKHAFGYAYNNYSDVFTQGTTSSQLNTTSGNHAMMATGVVNELRFGAYYNNLVTYSLDSGHIKRFSYWRQRLTNEQLKTYIS